MTRKSRPRSKEIHADYFSVSLTLQADGNILVGGIFTSLGGQPRNSIGRINADGTLDTTFDPGVGIDGKAGSLALQADGKILVGGRFTTLAGQSRNNIGRLNADGTLDGTFNPGAGVVTTLAVQKDGKILVIGDFAAPLSWEPSGSFIGRLNNTGPAFQSLSYDGTSIAWLRGGSSPEVWRTTFEHSADGLAWSLLGAGVRIAGGWKVTGVSLPQHGTLRARGYAVGGNANASSSIVEATLDFAIRLSLVRDGSKAVLSWTGGQGPYQVQQSTNLSQPGSWQDVGSPVQTNSISLPIGPGTKFLRVRGQ